MRATSKQNPDFINQTEMLNFACAMIGHCSIWLTTIAGNLKYVSAAFLLACSDQNPKSQIHLSTVLWTIKKKNGQKNDHIGKKYNNNSSVIVQ